MTKAFDYGHIEIDQCLEGELPTFENGWPWSLKLVAQPMRDPGLTAPPHHAEQRIRIPRGAKRDRVVPTRSRLRASRLPVSSPGPINSARAHGRRAPVSCLPRTRPSAI